MGAVMYALYGLNVDGDPSRVWGESWTFGTDPAGPLTLGSEPEIGGAEFQLNWLSTIEQDGATFNGRSDLQNRFSLDVICKRHSFRGDDAVRLYLEWRESLGRGKEQLPFVTMTDRGTRVILVRLAKANPMISLEQVKRAGGFREKVELVCDTSYWIGSGQSFYQTQTLEPTVIDNRGDRESFLTGEIAGPVTNFSIGVPGDVVTFTGTTIPSGEVWEFNTDPADRYVRNRDTGANKLPIISVNAGHPIFWRKGVPGKAIDHPLVIGGTGTNISTWLQATLPETHWLGVA